MFVRAAMVALLFGSAFAGPPARSFDFEGPASTEAPVAGDAETGQEDEVETDGPPLARWEEQLFFYSFLVVVLIVPFVMTRRPADPSSRAGRGQVTMGGRAGTRFTSDRERRLWLWAAVVLVVAIYSTLSPAQELAMALRERNLLQVTSGAFLLLVAMVIAALWARTRPGRLEIGAGIGVFAVYLVTLIRMPAPEARSHLFEYGLVAMLIYHALTERRTNGRPVPVPAVLAAVAVALLGWVDEGIQAFLPNRVYDLVDVGLNAAFGSIAILATLFLAWARRLDVMGRVRRALE